MSPAKKDAPDSYSNPLPSISLPKGGGALRDIGEKFTANSLTGTGSLSIPIFTTASRSDFFPKLTLSYDSGAGNGPFGIGWKHSIPSITRKTDKGLPKYQDASDSDIYILSEAEDLVPSFKLQANTWIRDQRDASDEQGQLHTVYHYRPRVEGLYARIERWENKNSREVHWRSITKDNITSVYGGRPDSRIADANDPLCVFTWLLTESYDDKGNSILYKYKAENDENIERDLPQEQHRLRDGVSFTQRYVKRILYGNIRPRPHDGTALNEQEYLFQVVFDYGEHATEPIGLQEGISWACRADPFSSFRPGFEVRTYRLCRRILMFHTIDVQELDNSPYLVRSTDFTYKETPVVSSLSAIQQVGYIKDAREQSGYRSKALPPLGFTYTEPVVDEQVYSIDPESDVNLPYGLDGSNYQWIDLDSEGISGILTEQANAWFYKRNLGEARFAPIELVATKPVASNLQSHQQQLTDLVGDGQKYLVQYHAPLTGFYEHLEDETWGPFTAFPNAPNIDWNDPNLKFIDLDGDGRSDLLLTEDTVFTWYHSLATDGFEAAAQVLKPFDEEKGPALVFADGAQSIYLADMVGDGLTDIVRVRNGEICYWPNMGYGHFGAKVIMDQPPFFDQPDSFEQRRIRFADIDGSGTTDLLYLGNKAITFWFNQAGNSWSAPHTLTNIPPIDNLVNVTVIDLLGTGTACIVWSSSLPAANDRPMRYINLMGVQQQAAQATDTIGQKPHLLQTLDNHMGRVITLSYAPSTRFYLSDRAAGHPWITRLPFPVHVVEKVETRDDVLETTLVTTYSYHHGYYDGIEREFRGFGLVEQRDADSFAQFKNTATTPHQVRIVEEDLYVPPVLTRTWLHTGAYLDRQNISRQFAHEYYSGDMQAAPLPDTALPTGLTAQEEQEACRALKGRLLRQEIYAEDGSGQSTDPYIVTEQTYAITMQQPVLTNPHGVFYAYEQEAISLHYERNAHDPRTTHNLTLEIDDFGNITRSASLSYPRRTVDPALPEQGRVLITYNEADFINKPDEANFYRLGVAAETRSYEITGVDTTQQTPLTLTAVAAAIQQATEIFYEVAPAANSLQKRLIECSRHLYWKDDLSGPLPLHEVAEHALLYEQYKLAFTPGLLQLYGNRVDTNLLTNEGKYRQGKTVYRAQDWLDDSWWIPSGVQFYDGIQFYLPYRFTDPFGGTTSIIYDPFALLVVETHDALPAPQQNIIKASYSYRTMQPALVTETNGNRSAAQFDELGMVTAIAVMGKENGPQEGNTLADPTIKIEYHLSEWMQPTPHPNFVHTLSRETDAVDTRWQEAYSYSDGSGHEVMKKVQAEPGVVQIVDAQGNITTIDTTPQVRWVGTGRTIYDNKGNPVKKYEPYFSLTFEYESEQSVIEQGVTPILHYDPLGRLIRTDNPNQTFSKVEFDAWKQTTWDENDTVLESQWYAVRQLGATPPPTPQEQNAAQSAAAHANTPAIEHFDPLGRTFLKIASNGQNPADQYETRITLDIQGNQRAIIDALKRTALVNDFTMLGRTLHTNGIDAGERWMLRTVVDTLLNTWNDRGFQVSYEYDELHRQTHLYVQKGNNTKILAEHVIYGEYALTATDLNLKGKPYQHYDGSGVLTNEHYDFKGNLLSNSRRLVQDYQALPDWSGTPSMEGETFTSSTTYDALNRPTSMTTPDRSVTLLTYNEANLLEKIDVSLRGPANATLFVKNFDYNARGQRTLIEYGNGVSTTYEYDRETFHLRHLQTRRPTDAPQDFIQDVHYTYDPVGNVVEMQDLAQQTIFFNNAKVAPDMQYIYDPLYRLLQANGREHRGQTTNLPPGYNLTYDYGDFPRVQLPHPNDGNAMQSYSEEYVYDPVGNIQSMQHSVAGAATWKRRYTYEPGNIPVPASNRLYSTSFPGDPDNGSLPQRYQHDTNGNMTQMPHLSRMQWDFRDQLQQVDLNVNFAGGSPTTAYYMYDASGQRVRKVVQSGSLIKERIYIGGYEIYRERNGGGLSLERETLHIMDDKRRIALVETQTIDMQNPTAINAPAIRYQLSNHLDSATLELDETGAIITYEEYYPYGGTSYQAGRSLAEVSLKRYRYTGKERDDETGLYYYGARYCAVWLGRWVSCDPAGIIDGTNLYECTHSNPIRWSDPTGRQAVDSGSKPEDISPDKLTQRLASNFAEQTSPSNLFHQAIQSISNWFRHQLHPSPAELGLNIKATVGESKGADGTGVRFIYDVSTKQITKQYYFDPSNQKGTERILREGQRYASSPSEVGHLIHKAGIVAVQAVALENFLLSPEIGETTITEAEGSSVSSMRPNVSIDAEHLSDRVYQSLTAAEKQAIGDNLTGKAAVARGESILGTEVTFRIYPSGSNYGFNFRIDTLTKSNLFKLLESKYGPAANVKGPQKRAFQLIRGGNFDYIEGRGKRAAAAGLGGIRLTPQQLQLQIDAWAGAKPKF